eukprot:4955846-Prorocentrum_lima.AAC.1
MGHARRWSAFRRACDATCNPGFGDAVGKLAQGRLCPVSRQKGSCERDNPAWSKEPNHASTSYFARSL